MANSARTVMQTDHRRIVVAHFQVLTATAWLGLDPFHGIFGPHPVAPLADTGFGGWGCDRGTHFSADATRRLNGGGL